MAKITIKCKRCGDQLTTHDVDEMAAWNREHDERCTAARPSPATSKA